MGRIASLLFLGLAACRSTPSGTRESPVRFELDLSGDLPFVTVSATSEQLRRLNARYVSFKVYLGSPEANVHFAVQQAFEGPLILPWTLHLRNFSSPFPLRLVGTLPDGKQETVHEETLRDRGSDL